MFIHLGGDVMVIQKDVIAIFDCKIEDASSTTAEFLKMSSEKRKTIVIDPSETKSFILTNEYLYYSPISSLTLKKRAAFLDHLD